MAEPPSNPDSNREPPDDTGAGPGGRSRPSTPRWVKAFGIIAVVFVLLVGIMLLTGGGNHGPGRHSGSGDSDGQAAPSSDGEPGPGGHKPPPGGH